MLNIYSVLLLHSQIAKYKNQNTSFYRFSANLKVFKGFKGSPRGPVSQLWILGKIYMLQKRTFMTEERMTKV